MSVLISIGSNKGDRKKFLEKAKIELESIQEIQILQVSKILETEPLLFTKQRKFLNQILHIETNFEPLRLLEICKEIEKKIGRKPNFRFGPREIDLDILYFKGINQNSEILTLPHPALESRPYIKEILNSMDILLPYGLSKTHFID